VSELTEAIGFYGVIALIAVLAHEPWRWLGLVLGRTVSVEGEVFQWVRAVATALVAGLVLRLILFPAGALANVHLGVRLAALGGGIAIFFVCRRSLGLGVVGGATLLIAGIALRYHVF
jgi:Branched-chain amino acid transport protein (AzlD)